MFKINKCYRSIVSSRKQMHKQLIKYNLIVNCDHFYKEEKYNIQYIYLMIIL